jgi:hypothetical protein
MVMVRDGIADRLPFEDDAFDAAVASPVLCTLGRTRGSTSWRLHP